jgi:hypothetical protein
MNEHPLKNVVIGFDLPFVLRVVDSIRKETTPDGYQQYLVAVQGVPMMLRFDKKLRDLGGVQIATEDRRGLLNYSTAQVWFDKQFFNVFGVKENYRSHADEFLAYALEGINRFLELYRRATGSFWIRRVKRSEIPSIRMVAIRWDGQEDPFVRGTLGTGRGLGSLLPAEQDQVIRHGLASQWVPDDLERFGYLVDLLLDQEDYWGAALAVEIYFEAQFARLLRRIFAMRGVREDEIDGKFDTSNGFPRSITSLLTTYVRDLTGAAVDDLTTELGQAYQRWASDARDLRNEIAHGKQLAITQHQAAAAAAAVRGLLRALDDALSPILRAAGEQAPSSAGREG